MLIQNYGLFWRRNNVTWGSPGQTGSLKGFSVKENVRYKTEVDFRDQIGVYVLYDDAFKIVYIGQAGSRNQFLLKRLKDHTSDALAERWTKFSWFGVRGVKSGKLSIVPLKNPVTVNLILDHIEAILISAAEPPHNRQGGRFGKEVAQYLQFRDEV